MDGLLQTLPQHGVETANRFVAETSVLHTLVPLDSAGLPRLVVELLNVQSGQLFEFDFTDSGDDVFFDVVAVILGGTLADGGFGVVFKPESYPLSNCEIPIPCYINLLAVLYGLL